MKIEPNTYRSLRLVLSSGNEDYPGCKLIVAFARWYITIPLPALIRPERQWVDISHYEWACKNVDGTKGYWESTEREYGFSLTAGGDSGLDFLIVFLGRQSGDSETEQSWSWFLPWLQHRFWRYSLYGLEGEHVWTQLESEEQTMMRAGGRPFENQTAAKERVPKVTFAFRDYDGEEIVATTCIEEREWRRGTGAFAWLSWFYRPKISRSLDIKFSKQTGPKKGSWKGGTLGHGIEIGEDELHRAAFERYCGQHGMTLI